MIKSSIAQFINVSTLVRRKWVRNAIIALIVIGGNGCNLSDEGMTSYLPPDKYLASLSLEHHAINLSTDSPFDTVTLKAVGLMGDGSESPDDIEYSVSDPSISITNGILKAESAIPKAIVRAKLTHGLITRTDSAIVSVTKGSPTLLSEFGFGLAVGDSAKIAIEAGTKMITLLRKSGSGSNLSALHISVGSADATVASIKQVGNSLIVNSNRSGRVMLYTSTYAYGTTWRDSLVFTVGWPINFSIPIHDKFISGTKTKILEFAYKDIAIGVGACVKWDLQSELIDLELDVVFDDPAKVAAPIGSECEFSVYDPSIGGNIAPYQAIIWDNRELGQNPTPEEFAAYLDAYKKAFLSQRQSRVFSSAGLYPFRSTINGTSGIIRVCDEKNDTTCAPKGFGPWY